MANETLKMNTIPCLNVNKFVDISSKIYISYINKNISFKKMPAIMLWGPPGVGKSQSIHQIAKKIETETKKKVIITDVRLLLFNPIDLRGIPTSNADKTLSVWLKPKIFDMNEDENVINILFLDEISSAPPSVQAAAYQIVLDRVVGEHKLPDNCIVVAAGNRLSDKSVSYSMPKALANRLMHIEIKTDFSSWEKWAIKNNINFQIINFLRFRQDFLMNFEKTKDDEYAFATPRSWEMVSNVLNNVDPNVDNVYHLISGLIGVGIALEFRNFSKFTAKLPKIEDILSGNEHTPIKDHNVSYALVNSLTSYFENKKYNDDELNNLVKFARTCLSKDFQIILIKGLLNSNIKKDLLDNQIFRSWYDNLGHFE